MSWRRFLIAHLPGILLAAATFLIIWPVAMTLRTLQAPAIVVLAMSVGVTAITQLILISLIPQFLLGQDGKYMVETLTRYVAVKFNQVGWVRQAK